MFTLFSYDKLEDIRDDILSKNKDFHITIDNISSICREYTIKKNDFESVWIKEITDETDNMVYLTVILKDSLEVMAFYKLDVLHKEKESDIQPHTMFKYFGSKKNYNKNKSINLNLVV